MAGLTLEQLLNELGRLTNMADALRDAMFSDPKEELERQTALTRIETGIVELVGATEVKVDAIGRFILNLTRRGDECREDSKALAQRAKKWENKSDWLRRLVIYAMQQQQKKKLEGARVTMTLVKGRETPAVDDVVKLPQAYLKAVVFTLTVSPTDAEQVDAVLGALTRSLTGATVVAERIPDMQFIKLALNSGEVAGASTHVGDPYLKVYVAQREGLVAEDDPDA